MLYRETVQPETFSLLKELSASPFLTGFSLAGGTALALKIGHRISVDLDFFGKRNQGVDEILTGLMEVYPLQEMNRTRNMLSLNISNIKVDIVNYQYPLIKPLVSVEGLTLYSKEDIAAMKLAAIKGRGRKRDFFDLYFLLKEFSLKQMLDFHCQKFNDDSEFLIIKSLSYFEDAENDPEPLLLNEKINWDEVKDKVRDAIRKFKM